MGSVASRLTTSCGVTIRSASRFESLAGRPGHGPFFRISLTIEGGAIAVAEFETLGCPWSQKIGATFVSVLRCTTPEKAELLLAEDLSLLVGPLPRHKRDLSGLAVMAMQQALRDWRAGVST